MAPHLGGATISFAKPTETAPIKKQQNSQETQHKLDIVWPNVALFVYFFFSGIFGLYLALTAAKWKTVLWSMLLMVCGNIGHSAGSHRLWSHRSYKANLPLRIILAFFATMCFENHIYEWVRDHRVHHKCTDTDGDPHNASRGFFFSHCGWLMVRKHKDVISNGKTIDLSDLEEDSVVMFQKKYSVVLMLFCCFIFPSVVPWYCWGENGFVSYFVAGIGRYFWGINVTWLVNSAAHTFGTKPYDKTIGATDSETISYVAAGEGWHNYHHTFPWDYRASEIGYRNKNLAAAFIDFFAWLGWASDLKTTSPDMIRRRMLRTGDGTKVPPEGEDPDDDASLPSHSIWGWGDASMKPEDFQYVKRLNVK